MGDDWARERRSLVLRVPSVIIPAEFNYVLEIGHRKFAALRPSGPEPFAFDPRLLPRN